MQRKPNEHQTTKPAKPSSLSMESRTIQSPHKLHFVVIPYMAPGHLIPMVDLGRLLADYQNLVTIITTPKNANRFKSTIDRAKLSGCPLQFVTVPFPAADFGLPEGCENLVDVPTGENLYKFFACLPKMEYAVKTYIRQQQSTTTTPICIVSDFCHLWTRHLANELNVPRFVFYSVCCFTLLCDEILPDHYEREKIDDERKPVVVPEIDHLVEVTRIQTPGFFDKRTEFYNEAKEAEATADGIIVNTFVEMEPTYVDRYKTVKGKKVWPIGPVALCNKEITEKSTRGSPSSTAEISNFLDSMRPKSVVYVSLGSLARTPPAQVVEIGVGLEESGHPFVWVIQSRDKMGEVESWLERTRFEERNREKGLVVKGWAPQLVILSHPSVGGFLTHCGWNSTIEGIGAGLPMVTWPCFCDQFLNERFVVDVVRTGVMVGVKEPVWWWEEVVVVQKEKVAEVVKELMGCGEDAVERRRRAVELAVMANKAMDVGGSSIENLKGLIDEVMGLVEKKYKEIRA